MDPDLLLHASERTEGSDRAPMVRSPLLVVAALTCFNRREQTLAALGALDVAARRAGVNLRAVLVDDASKDGTTDAVRATYSWVDVIQGTGYLFWNRGMAMAMDSAKSLKGDFLLWLNDDTLLFPDSLERMLREQRELSLQEGRAATLVGSTIDAAGRLSYGGSVSVSRVRRFQYRKVWNPESPVPCEAMNGNCVLVPASVWAKVGDIDPVYEHAMGDTDYALRIRSLGLPLYVASGHVGRCSTNPVSGSFNDRSLPLGQRWRSMMDTKGLPWRSWLHFTRRHGGLAWLLYFVWPYLRLIASALLRRRGRLQT